MAPYLDYGSGEGGWRHKFCLDTNARCVLGEVDGQTFQAWFLARVREVPEEYLTTALPERM